MKLLSVLFAVFMLSCNAQSQAILGMKLLGNDTINFTGKTVHFIGNSITAGNSGPSDLAHRWTTVFSGIRGNTENNMGISGQCLQVGTTCGATQFNKATIPVYATSKAALFISLGINDIGINTPDLTVDAFKRTLDTVIYFAMQKGWPPKRIILLTPYWVSAYTAYNSYTGCGHVLADSVRHEQYVVGVIAVGNFRNCTVIDMYSVMKASPAKGTFLSSDGLHPSDTGAAFIANYLASLTYHL